MHSTLSQLKCGRDFAPCFSLHQPAAPFPGFRAPFPFIDLHLMRGCYKSSMRSSRRELFPCHPFLFTTGLETLARCWTTPGGGVASVGSNKSNDPDGGKEKSVGSAWHAAGCGGGRAIVARQPPWHQSSKNYGVRQGSFLVCVHFLIHTYRCLLSYTLSLCWS